MGTQVQSRRGTTSEHSAFTGAVGEVTVDTDKDVVVVHDGVVAGGVPMLRQDGANSALALGTAASPSLKFTGDINTGLYSPGADQVAISTGGTGRMFVDSTGRVLVNLSSARTNFDNGTGTAGFQLEGADDVYRRAAIISSVNGTGGAILTLNHQRSGAIGGNTILVDGDQIGTISFQGSDGSEFISAGRFTAEVDGTPTADSVPGRMVFYTTDPGASSATEKMRIAANGKVGVGTGTLSARFTVAGNTTSPYATLTDAATIAVDLSLSNNFQVTLGGDRVLGAPTNVTAGQSGVIRVVQDATGGRKLSYNTTWKFAGGTIPTLTTTANAIDLLAYHVESATRIAVLFVGDVK